MTTLAVALTVFDFAFGFWPIFLISPLIKSRKNILRNVVYTWGLWAIIRLALFFNPEPITASMLIPEPLSTILFFITGAVLIAVYAGKNVRSKKKLQSKLFGVSATEQLANLSPVEFENMVAEIYRLSGHKAKITGKSGDHGVDILVNAKNGEKWVVQCKRWRTPVGESVVRDFYGTMQHEKAAQGAIITASRFTKPAIEWAKGKPIRLYNGEQLLKIWNRAKQKQTNS